jgi:predicted transcriptional regulator/DNA-binding XRE family transcriptional regulator
MTSKSPIGAKIRGLRQRERVSQAELARRLGISSSYLNLIEQNRRPLPAELLVRLTEVLPLDMKALSSSHDERTIAELLEVFGDVLFEHHPVITNDVREFATGAPTLARAVIRLYEAYRAAQHSAHDLAEELLSDGGEVNPAVHVPRLPTEEINDLIQQHLNYFPELEHGAEALAREAALEGDPFTGLTDYLRRSKGVEVRIGQAGQMQSALRRFDRDKQILWLSEVLRRGSRNFQLAYQVGLLTQSEVLNRIAADPLLTTNESRALCRVALANYFASCVLMPYEAFLRAARDERYDIELLGHRFRVSFEQTCHRLTTLRRPGAEGIPLHMMRIDIAGNISKRFSASGLRFARFSGACPRWNVFGAFLTPGLIRTQLSHFPDGSVFFEVARTVRKESGGYRSPRMRYAIAMGCDVAHAREMVYADGLDLASRDACVRVGPTCRLCEWADCEQRAYPPVQHWLTIDENVRGLSFYAPIRD